MCAFGLSNQLIQSFMSVLFEVLHNCITDLQLTCFELPINFCILVRNLGIECMNFAIKAFKEVKGLVKWLVNAVMYNVQLRWRWLV